MKTPESAFTHLSVLQGFSYKQFLGQGAYGAVYEIIKNHPENKQYAFMPDRMALKIIQLPKEKLHAYKEMIEKEARIIANLKHENIVSVYDLKWEDNVGLIFMDLVEGRPLSELIKENSLTLDQKILIFKKLLQAVSYSHKQKVIHHDIKPGNILVSANLSPVLCDFGLATFHQHPHGSHSNFKFGTPLYMAPEKINNCVNHRLVHQTDLFSMGVLGYELFSGKKAFYAKNRNDVFQLILNYNPPSLNDIDPHIPFMINQCVMKLIRKSPSERYLRADQAQSDLNNSFATLLTKKIFLTLTVSIMLLIMGYSLIAQHSLFSFLDTPLMHHMSSWKKAKRSPFLFNENTPDNWAFYHDSSDTPDTIPGLIKGEGTHHQIISDTYPSLFVNKHALPKIPFYIQTTINPLTQLPFSFGLSASPDLKSIHEILWITVDSNDSQLILKLAYPHVTNIFDEKRIPQQSSCQLKLSFYYPDFSIFLNETPVVSLPVSTFFHFWEPLYFSVFAFSNTPFNDTDIFEMSESFNNDSHFYIHRLLQLNDSKGLIQFLTPPNHQKTHTRLLHAAHLKNNTLPSIIKTLDAQYASLHGITSGTLLYHYLNTKQISKENATRSLNALEPLEVLLYTMTQFKHQGIDTPQAFTHMIHTLLACVKNSPSLPSYFNFFTQQLILNQSMYQNHPDVYFKITEFLTQLQFKFDNSLSQMIKEYMFNHAIWAIENHDYQNATALSSQIKSHFSLSTQDLEYLNIIDDAVLNL